MTEKKQSDARSAYAIFCDDIREEKSGKLTMVGVYSDSLFVPTVPSILPSLCLFLTIHTPASQPFRELTVRLFRDDTLLFETDAEFSQAVVAAQSQLPRINQGDASELFGYRLRHMLRMEPFLIEQAGKLRVRVETESEILRAGGLNIIVGQPAEQSTGAASDSP